MGKCHVCGNPPTEQTAYARIALTGEVYLICCPMCLTAIPAGALQRRMNSRSHSSPRASVLVEHLPAVQVGGDYGWAHAVVADVSGHGITSSLVASRLGESRRWDKSRRVVPGAEHSRADRSPRATNLTHPRLRVRRSRAG